MKKVKQLLNEGLAQTAKKMHDNLLSDIKKLEMDTKNFIKVYAAAEKKDVNSVADTFGGNEAQHFVTSLENIIKAYENSLI